MVVLDRDLPGTHGDDICRTLVAERCESRVLMLTAASSVKDRVEGLGLGADDYLPKPFDFAEMVARVQALGRAPGLPQPDRLGYGDLSLDPVKRVATRAGRPLALSPRSSPSWNACSPPRAGRSRPRNCSNGCGTRPPTRSPRPSKPPSTGCGPSSVTRRSSRPSATAATASEDSDARPSSPARAPAWRRWPRRTARLRLTALYGGLFLLSGAALVAITYVLFEQATAYTKPRLTEDPSHSAAIQHLQLPSAGPPAACGSSTCDPAVSWPRTRISWHRTSTSWSATVLRVRWPGDTGPASAGPGPASAGPGPASAGPGRCNQLAQAVHQLAQAGTVQAAQRAADSHQLLVNSGIALAIVAVLALLAGWLVAGRMLRPIRTITRTARRISSTSLHERLALDGPQDELKELGDTLDDLFARLEAAFEAQRHFVANASHELRTPLTAERTLLQVALDDPDTSDRRWRSTAEEVLASSDEQAHLIEALLTLASSESGLNGHEPVDLAATVLRPLPASSPRSTDSGSTSTR